MSFVSTDVVDNFKINVSGDISCKDEGTGNGGIISSLFLEQDNGPNYKIKSAKCSILKIDNDIDDYKKDTKLNNVCDCEVVDEKAGFITCPDNKFVRTYYPALKKGLCCSPCSFDSLLKTQFTQTKCQQVIKTSDEMKCPPGTYVRKISTNKTAPSIECCYPTPLEISKGNEEECKKYGFTTCSNRDIKKLREKCKTFGITDCNVINVDAVMNKCKAYGQRYYDDKEKKYINTDSPIECHVDNFEKLDEKCKQHGITECTVQNLNSKVIDGINSDIQKINTVQEAQLEEISVFENTFIGKSINLLSNTSLFFLCSFLMLLLIIIIIIGMMKLIPK